MSSTGPGGFTRRPSQVRPMIVAPAEIDVASAPDLAASLWQAGHGAPTIIVDMTQTQFCDCSVLGVLIPARERAVTAGGELLLAISSTNVLKIFEITGFDKIFRIFPSVTLAAASRPGPLAHPAVAGARDDGQRTAG